MIIRCVGAALSELGKGFRRVRSFCDIADLYRALDARDAEMGLQVEQEPRGISDYGAATTMPL